jgi:N-acyl homoserine lactone hydrolase
MHQPAAPQRLYLMQVASMSLSGIPCVCYLVQTSAANILIDSGLPDNFALPLGREAPVLGKPVVAQLAEIGLQPDDIDTVIITHYDGDHIGQLDKFPHARLVVQRAQYDQAHQGHPRFAPTRTIWDQPVERHTFVDGDTDWLPGLRLIDTSGHVPGHQSVLVRLPQTGPVLLAIDAVPQAAAFTPDRAPAPINQDEAAVVTSTQKLIALAQQEGVSLVIFGHDPAQWATLKKLPACYE